MEHSIIPRPPIRDEQGKRQTGFPKRPDAPPSLSRRYADNPPRTIGRPLAPRRPDRPEHRKVLTRQRIMVTAILLASSYLGIRFFWPQQDNTPLHPPAITTIVGDSLPNQSQPQLEFPSSSGQDLPVTPKEQIDMSPLEQLCLASITNFEKDHPNLYTIKSGGVEKYNLKEMGDFYGKMYTQLTRLLGSDYGVYEEMQVNPETVKGIEKYHTYLIDALGGLHFASLPNDPQGNLKFYFSDGIQIPMTEADMKKAAALSLYISQNWPSLMAKSPEFKKKYENFSQDALYSLQEKIFLYLLSGILDPAKSPNYRQLHQLLDNYMQTQGQKSDIPTTDLPAKPLLLLPGSSNRFIPANQKEVRSTITQDSATLRQLMLEREQKPQPLIIVKHGLLHSELYFEALRERLGLPPGSPLTEAQKHIIPKAVVIHITAGGKDAETVVDYLNSKNRGWPTVQFVIGQDGKVHQIFADENSVELHVMGMNSVSFGIEIVANDEYDVKGEQIVSTALLIKKLKKQYPIEFVVSHKHAPEVARILIKADGELVKKGVDADFHGNPDPGPEVMEALRKLLEPDNTLRFLPEDIDPKLY